MLEDILKNWCASDCQCAIYFRLKPQTNCLKNPRHNQGVEKKKKNIRKFPTMSFNPASEPAPNIMMANQPTISKITSLGIITYLVFPDCRTFEDFDLRLFPVKGG